jgi:opacity protein-like surface antigen
MSYDAGHILGIGLGRNLTPHLAAELEFAYRKADVDMKGIIPQSFSGSVEAKALMLNGVYSFGPLGANRAWHPYVGAGLGRADLAVEELTADDSELLDDFEREHYGVAFQAMAGARYSVNSKIGIIGELRLFGMNGQGLENGWFSFETNYRTIDVLLGANYAF